MTDNITYNWLREMPTSKIILIVLGSILLYLVLLRVIRKLYHFPAPACIGRFLDSDIRRRLQPPDKLIQRSGIESGMTVMDLGCGSGAFTPIVARAVGNQGKIYAVDIQPEMLRQLEDKHLGCLSSQPHYAARNNAE